jgi:hypothetical protein
VFDPNSSSGDTLYVGDGNDNTVKQFDATTGAYLGTFVASGSGSLLGPRGLIFGRHHDLNVVNQNVGTTINGEVLRYDNKSGAFLNDIVDASNPHAPYAPRGMVRGPAHTLFVADLGDLGNVFGTGNVGRLIQFDDTTGAWLGDLNHSGFTGEFNPRGIVTGPDGDLYLAVRNVEAIGGHVLKFDPIKETFLGDFVDSNGTNDLNRPEGLVFGPDRNLHVTSFRADSSDNDKILEFNGTTGAYLGKIDLDQVGQPRAFAQALVFGPNGKLFVPITGDGPDTGEVRRYDVSTGTFDVFVPSSANGGALGAAWYLTFGNTDGFTLAYDGSSNSAVNHPAVGQETGHVAAAGPLAASAGLGTLLGLAPSSRANSTPASSVIVRAAAASPAEPLSSATTLHSGSITSMTSGATHPRASADDLVDRVFADL